MTESGKMMPNLLFFIEKIATNPTDLRTTQMKPSEDKLNTKRIYIPKPVVEYRIKSNSSEIMDDILRMTPRQPTLTANSYELQS